MTRDDHVGCSQIILINILQILQTYKREQQRVFRVRAVDFNAFKKQFHPAERSDVGVYETFPKPTTAKLKGSSCVD